MRLDGIVTLVDAKHIEQHLDEEKPEGAENEAVEQVAFADRILLNKTDLVSKAELKTVKLIITLTDEAADTAGAVRSSLMTSGAALPSSTASKDAATMPGSSSPGALSTTSATTPTAPRAAPRSASTCVSATASRPRQRAYCHL